MIRQTATQRAITAFARAAAIPYYRWKLKRFESLLQTAAAVQRGHLFEKIRRCANTRFGRDHGFAKIRTVEDFRRQIPISRYEYLSPYIRSVSEGHLDTLFPADEELLAFACTTGTTGDPKLNPVTRRWLNEYKRSWEIWGVKGVLDHSWMIGSRILQLTGPGNLSQTPSGLSVGMVSSVAVRFQSPLVRSFYATPLEVADIAEPTAKYYTILRLSITQSIGFLAGITPSNLLRLAEVGHEHRESLIRDIHDGTLRSDLQVTTAFRQLMSQRLAIKHPERARELEQIVNQTGTLYPKDYWQLGLISCWLGGTIGYQSRNLSNYYGTAPARDLGLVSTEGRHTIPLQDGRPEGVLAIDGTYYEFVPVEEIESPNPTILEGHELEEGREYFLMMTTSSGLYRYDIEDVVRCNGFVGEAPVLEFLHKGKQCADMEGEKISGYQVVEAVEAASRELGLHVACFTAVPVRRPGETPYYALLIERSVLEDDTIARKLLQLVDQNLIRHNVMYSGKRQDRYIGPWQLVRLAVGTWAKFIAEESQRRGTGDSQFKHPPLVTETAWMDQFQTVDTVRLT